MSPVVLSEPTVLSDVYVSSLVNETYRHLEATSFGILNRLTGYIGDDATELVVDFDTAKAIRPNAYLCIDAEVMYVWNYDEATRTATVQRAMLGSRAVAHTAGALIQIQPRVSTFDVLTQLAHEIRSWPPALYQIDTLEITRSSLARAYDLAGAYDAYRVLEGRHTSTASTSPRTVSFHVDFNADITTYPSGKAIIFTDPMSTGITEVVFARPFTTDPFELDTPLSQIGITETMRDIPVLGAAARLLREAPRTDIQRQGQSRLAEEVPPGHTGSTRTALRREADNRIHQEIARLRERYPQRRQ